MKKISKNILILFIPIFLTDFWPQVECPDFGPEGLGDLSSAERVKLIKEEVLIPEKPLILAEGKTVITGALIIRKNIDKVWIILSQPERQVDYLDEIKEARCLGRDQESDRVYFKLEILGIDLEFTVIHRYYPGRRALAWSLDREAKNDLREFHGFWRLYPWERDKTLARYGSQVKPKFKLAELVIHPLYRQRVRNSLLAVKKYIEKQ